MFKIPSDREEIFETLANEVKSNLPKSNPWKFLSLIRAILIAFASIIFSYYKSLEQLINAFFDDTTYGEYLDRKASIIGLSRLNATVSQGQLYFEGTAGTTIPASTLVNLNSVEYVTTSVDTITHYSHTVTITYDTNIATVTDTAHGLTTGLTLTIAGATPLALNGANKITVIDEDTYIYDTTLTGTGIATGTITADFDIAITTADSVDAGNDKNQARGTEFKLNTPVTGINDTCFAGFDGFIAGTDDETDDDFRTRYLDRKRNPYSTFNTYAIEAQIKTLSWVKKVKIYEITPAPGQVTIYCLKENNAVPNASEITLMKNKVIEIKPAHIDPADIFVLAPTPISIDVEVNNVNPYIASIYDAIENTVIAFFIDRLNTGDSLEVNDLIEVINSTFDSVSGQAVEDFALIQPTSNYPANAGEILVLGNFLND